VEMAAAGAGKSVDANLQGLGGKRDDVKHYLCKASECVLEKLYDEDLFEQRCAFSRDGVVFLDVHYRAKPLAVLEDWEECDESWNRVVSEGLGTKFEVTWWGHRQICDLRILRRGETIFQCMQSEGLSPAWNGTPTGKFTITVVDKEGAQMALAMALHPRLGASSRLSLVSSLVPIMAGGLQLYHENLSCDFVGHSAFGCLASVWKPYHRMWQIEPSLVRLIADFI